ncbi:MAG: hypothetical protein ACPL28_06040 [bacterium]
MSKKILFLAIIIISISFCSAQHFGVGLIIGSPTGLTGKFIITQRSAVAVNVGWNLFGTPKRLHITGDYQFLFPTVLHWTDDMTGEERRIKGLTPYLGIGGRFKFVDNEADDETELRIGLRLGGGAEYKISRFGIFLELYPVVDILPGTDFDFEGGLGARFYF